MSTSHSRAFRAKGTWKKERATSRRARGRTQSAKGIWKKERATGRKYSKSDEHKAPKAHSRSKYWVGEYERGGRKVQGSFRSNPGYRKHKK